LAIVLAFMLCAWHAAWHLPWCNISFKSKGRTVDCFCPIVDTHAHLCDPTFDPDLNQVLQRASAAGVSCVIAVGEDLSDARRNLQLADAYSAIRPAAGLYPTRLSLEQAATMVNFIRTHRQRLVAIGEVGLDYWAVKEENERQIQRRIFSMFIDLSLELDLPLNVHSRSAGRHAVDMLLSAGARKVQLHAFDGKASSALPAVEADFFFSVPPSIVRSRQKQKLVELLPLSSLLLETDSPVLGPSPGQRNEPANIRIALEAITLIKKNSLDAVIQAIFDNTRRLYGSICP
jgi:TatD DNase family protein